MTMTTRPHRLRRPPPMAVEDYEAAVADAVLHRAITRLQGEGLAITTVVDALLEHVVEIAAREPGRPAVRRRLARALREVDALRAQNLARQYDFL